MIMLSAVLCKYKNGDYAWWCPGCRHAHSIPADMEGAIVEAVGERWRYNGNFERPTFTPSVRHFHTKKDGSEQTDCHYNITDGQIQFHGDCAHVYAGVTVPMKPLADHSDYGWPE